eukprot:959901-Ditylum_brightwellii.AAC.1
MKEGESWKGTFCGKSAKSRPDWDDEIKMCACWFIKGDCFSDCKNAASHVAEKDVSDERKKAF